MCLKITKAVLALRPMISRVRSRTVLPLGTQQLVHERAEPSGRASHQHGAGSGRHGCCRGDQDSRSSSEQGLEDHLAELFAKELTTDFKIFWRNNFLRYETQGPNLAMLVSALTVKAVNC